MTATRQAVAAYVASHREASHRQIAAALGTSPSSVDRECRRQRQLTHAECSHGQADARHDAPGDRSASVRHANAAPLRQRVNVALTDDAVSAPVAVVADAPDDAFSQRWRCDYCAAWVTEPGVGRCLDCGWPKGRPR